ncbi:DUF1173 family protein [Nonomuraea sp. SYSU D8015]|uniref:DUF1173 family protein n=1 Tax=Nonomuraea sp. SYSU D8015 TaxID=2593644 RepID=UPI00166126F3|nr:DUF1173 family protein [Nonomuraea sp. SYSU D8015]
MVELAGQRVALASLRRVPERFSRLFAAAKANAGYGLCLCIDPPLRLVIRARKGRYHLAGWPGEGDKHAAGCDFHKIMQLSGRSSYTAGAIEETEQGTRVRLAIPLHLGPGRMAVARTPPPTSEGVPSATRRSVGLLGMLHLVWQEAGLSEWREPGRRRTWSDCHQALHREVVTCAVNDLPLSAVLYLVPPYRPENASATMQAFDRFCGELGTRGRTTRRGMILGEIKLIEPTTYGHRIALRHQRTALFTDAQLLGRVRQSYRAAFSAAIPEQSRRIVLAVVERTDRGYLRAVDMAVMLTNAQYLPAESSHEVRMADHLVAAGRAFIKPLRYEAGTAVFPDFVLIDVEPRLCVEVYGVRGMQAYEERKRDKRAYYAAAGMPVLEWEVGEPLPDLPG